MVNVRENKPYDKNPKEKKSKSDALKSQVKGLRDAVSHLENSLSESEIGERQLLRHLQTNNIKRLSIGAQLNESRKENKQLLNILQRKCLEKYPSRLNTDFATPCATMSMVNLQYNYEELLGNHENLLKLLAAKDKDMERMCVENENVYKKFSEISDKLITCESLLKKVCIKYMQLRERKDTKISALENENGTLLLVHNQLVALLNNQYMESDSLLSYCLHNESIPHRALLLQEVQRANQYYHENILLKRELALLKTTRTNSVEML